MSPSLSTTATSDFPSAMNSGWGTRYSRPSEVRKMNGLKPPVICLRIFSMFIRPAYVYDLLFSNQFLHRRTTGIDEILRATAEVGDRDFAHVDAQVVIERGEDVAELDQIGRAHV